MESKILNEYKRWLELAKADVDIVNELQAMTGNEAAIEDAFYRDLEFGTGGLRGVIGAGTNRMNVYVVAKASQGLANYVIKEYGPEASIAIGFDSRIKSDLFAKVAASVFAANDLNVYLWPCLRPVPTLSFATRYLGCKAGVMITASHNPYNYNGIKVFVKGGLDAPKELTDKIEDMMHNDNNYFIPKPKKPGQRYLIEDINDYVDNIYSIVDKEKLLWKGPKLAFCGMNGSASVLFDKFMDDIGYSYFKYGYDSDPYFSSSATNTPEPIEENIAPFIDSLKRSRIVSNRDISLIFDGDGDRLMVLDDEYKAVDMNMLLCIYYWYLHEYRHETGAVIKNCVTTMRLNKMAEYYGEQCIEVPVGFKWITKGMIDYDALIGGESSGGFTYRGHVYGKDSILAAMMLLEVLAVTGMKLKEIVELIESKFGKYFTASTKLPIDTVNMVDMGPEAIISTLDGTKFSFPYGWGAVRRSGTEPVMRVMAEADSEDKLNDLMEKLEGNKNG